MSEFERQRKREEFMNRMEESQQQMAREADMMRLLKERVQQEKEQDAMNEKAELKQMKQYDNFYVITSKILGGGQMSLINRINRGPPGNLQREDSAPIGRVSTAKRSTSRNSARVVNRTGPLCINETPLSSGNEGQGERRKVPVGVLGQTESNSSKHGRAVSGGDVSLHLNDKDGNNGCQSGAEPAATSRSEELNAVSASTVVKENISPKKELMRRRQKKESEYPAKTDSEWPAGLFHNSNDIIDSRNASKQSVQRKPKINFEKKPDEVK